MMKEDNAATRAGFFSQVAGMRTSEEGAYSDVRNRRGREAFAQDAEKRQARALFDSHTHINNESYDEVGRAEVIAAIEASDLGYVVDVGFDIASSKYAVTHAAKYPWCYAAVGVHPSDVASMTEGDIDALRALAARETPTEGERAGFNPANKVVAIGEIGLDYHYDDGPPAEKQKQWFRRQLALGIELGMPIIIHDRESNGETLEIMKEAGAFSVSRVSAFPSADGFPDARVLLHCFSGDADEALAAIRLGAWISVAGPVTFKNNKKTKEVASAVPLSRLLIETDAPYLTPVPHRGKPNISPYVEFTAREIAGIRGIPYEELASVTTENAKRFYGIRENDDSIRGARIVC
jgi:TatD DNase family protein